MCHILKKQRDAVGLSVFSDTYEYYSPEKGSDRHHRMILNALENLLKKPKVQKTTDTIKFLHQIAEKIHRRSMIILFTDMFRLIWQILLKKIEMIYALQYKNRLLLFLFKTTFGQKLRYAIKDSTHLINKVPSDLIYLRTPWELILNVCMQLNCRSELNIKEPECYLKTFFTTY